MKTISIFTIFFGFVFPGYGQDGFVKGSPKLAYWKLSDKPQIIIALHGGPAVRHDYLRPEFDLLTKYTSIVYYDQRGCGLSEQDSTYIWEEHVKDLRRVIKTFSKKNKVFLVGSSWGSMLAMIYAYKHPEDVKGIILTGTVKWEGYNKPYRKRTYSRRVLSHKQILKETGILIRQNVDKSLSEETISIYKETEMYMEAPALDTRRSFISAPVIDSLSKILLPVLIFNGSRTCQIDCADEYMNVFPNARLHTIKGACHDPWMSDPNLFAEICNRFIFKYK